MFETLIYEENIWFGGCFCPLTMCNPSEISCTQIKVGSMIDQNVWLLHHWGKLSRWIETLYDKVLAKGCHPERKVQFFWTLFKRPLTPPPFYLNICPILQGVFFKTRFWALKMGVKIWYNVPISPPNFTINASKVPFHANFMLLNDLQNTRQFPT